MKIVRFSAVGNFGVPIDNPEQISDTAGIISLMGAYSLQGSEVTDDLQDITPYYWQDPTFRYYLSRRGVSGPAVIDLMPRHHDSSAFVILPSNRESLLGIEMPQRTIEIPTNHLQMAVVGLGPRFPGQLCIHELITVQ